MVLGGILKFFKSPLDDFHLPVLGHQGSDVGVKRPTGNYRTDGGGGGWRGETRGNKFKIFLRFLKCYV